MALNYATRELNPSTDLADDLMWRNKFMQEFRHGTIVCSCGYRTTRCDCCPGLTTIRPNVCLSCQTAMRTPNAVAQAIEALTDEAVRLLGTGQFLWPADPKNRRSGVCLTPREFLDHRDQHSLLVQIGCDWSYWSRRARIARWRELDNWQEWKIDGQENCFDCRAGIHEGFISFPLGVFLCPGCKEALDRAKEAQCTTETTESSGR